jgi:hypothetical protein
LLISNLLRLQPASEPPAGKKHPFGANHLYQSFIPAKSPLYLVRRPTLGFYVAHFFRLQPYAFSRPKCSVIDSPIAGAGEHRDIISHFNETHFDQGPEIIRVDGRQLRSLAPDIAQYPTEVDGSVAT